MFSLPSAQLELREHARKLADSVIAPRAARVDESQEYPWDNVQALTEAGFMGMTIPTSFGGLGLTFLDAAVVVEEMARVCGVTGRIVVEGNMGAISAIMKYGSDEHKRRCAELVLAGDKPAICITEPGAGSAASQMTTRADKVKDRYVINGVKHWITGGGVSRLHLIFARVCEEGEEQGIGGFIAFRDEDAGLRVGRREPTMGLRGIPETEIILENLELPADRLIEPPKGLARGFAGLMNAYNAQRVGAASVALGIAQGAYERALEYSQQREQFGRPICEFQGLQWMLVDMATLLDASRALIHRAASSGGAEFPDVQQAAQAKIFASESAVKVTNDALQILRTVVASKLLGRKLPQTRDGYARASVDSQRQ